jgi:hypothetical protein
MLFFFLCLKILVLVRLHTTGAAYVNENKVEIWQDGFQIKNLVKVFLKSSKWLNNPRWRRNPRQWNKNELFRHFYRSDRLVNDKIQRKKL